jgi:hypothetical protein
LAEAYFSIEHTERSGGSFKKKKKRVDRGMREELGELMNQIIHKQNTQKPEYV